MDSNIQRLRKEKKLSQKQLADLIGVSQTAIYYWEKGERQPKIEQLQKLADVLNVDITSLAPQIDFHNAIIPTEYLVNEDYKPILEYTVEEEKRYFNGNDTIDYKSFLESVDKTNYNKLLRAFKKLNSSGKEKAVERVEELTEIKKYTEPEEE